MRSGRTKPYPAGAYRDGYLPLNGLHRRLVAAFVLTCIAGSATSETELDFSRMPDAKIHDFARYKFRTDSMAGEIYDNDKRSFWVEVENQRNHEMRVIWHIAWLDQWILPNATERESRPQRVGPDRSTEVFPSCVSYGNRGSNFVYTPLIGTPWEKKKSKSQVEAKCAGLKGLTTPVFDVEDITNTAIEPFERDYEVLFPSSLEKAASTMLAFRANYTLKPEGPTAFAINLEYQVGRVEGYSDGDPRSMTVTIFQASAKDDIVETALKNSYPDGFEIPLTDDSWTDGGPSVGSISFFIEAKNETVWRMAKLGFSFKTEDKNDVATLYVPIFTRIP